MHFSNNKEINAKNTTDQVLRITLFKLIFYSSNRRNRSQWPMELNEKRTLDLTASSKENALKL
jgi:hypothetical protein